MKKFIIRVGCFLAILILLLAFAAIITIKKSPESSNSYMAAIIDKHDYLESIEGSKIIITGGSNIAFGIDSEKIENEFGVPVVNLALHAGLGARIIINEAMYSMSPNDIVLISFEYFLALDGNYPLVEFTKNFYDLDNFVYKNRYDKISYNIKKIFSEISTVRSNIKNFQPELYWWNKKGNIYNEYSGGVYTRDGFNKHGDVISHLGLDSPVDIYELIKPITSYSHWETIDYLNEFYKTAQKKNVKVFFIIPPFTSIGYEKSKNALDAFYKDIQHTLKFPVIGTPKNFVFNEDNFFDSVDHLNENGREKRTQLLIEKLKENPDSRKAITEIGGVIN